MHALLDSVAPVPASDYVRGLRARIGRDYVLLPGVTAVIQNSNRFLVARQHDSGLWSLVGGSIEPGEEPEVALLREVREELGVEVSIRGIVGAYGGSALETTYPNGDRVGYVTIAYRCGLSSTDFALEPSELVETRWLTPAEIAALDRHPWIDKVIHDAVRAAP